MIIAIVGPTGVGKTKLSVELAKKLDAEIINADSVAIYRKLDIGSAKPTKEEMEGIKHHLIDICDVEEEYTIFDYQRDARKIIDNLLKQNKNIILVGGSGLYLKAALYDYKFTEGTTNKLYDDLSNEEILNRIKEYNIDKLPHINNRKRLVRTLNKLENGEEVDNNKDKLLYPCKVIGLTTDRDYLYKRINDRVDLMINKGLVDEVISLKDKYKNSRILNSAIGYKEFYNFLYNDLPIEEIIDKIKLDSRRFAKRQYTFFNHQFSTKWFDVDFANFNNTVTEVWKYVRSDVNE